MLAGEDIVLFYRLRYEVIRWCVDPLSANTVIWIKRATISW